MALAITFPTSLPDARTGLDYGAANVTAIATGGTSPYVWSLAVGGTPPAGLVIDATTGKLSGIITDACDDGPFSVWIKVVDAVAATVTVQVDLFVSPLPNGLDLLVRMPTKDQSGAVLTNLNIIAASALQTITAVCGVPFAAAGSCAVPSFTQEVMNRNRYSALAFPQWRPVQTITAAWSGVQVLTVGTVYELMTQVPPVHVAIESDGKAVRFRYPSNHDGPGPEAISYTAGYATLPSDLYEVFCELGRLMWLEKDRAGMSVIAVGDAQTTYSKKLPEWCDAVLMKYGSVGAMV